MVRIGRAAPTLLGHMPPSQLQGKQLHRLVRQAVKRVINDEQCEAVLQDALSAVKLDQVPDDLGQFAEFLLGPLTEAVSRHASADDATTILQSLEEVVGAKLEAEITTRAEEGRATPSDAPKSNAPATVLLVENDLLIRAELGRVLRAEGYTVVSAPDGNLALAMCVRCRPRLVIAGVAPNAGPDDKLVGLMQVAFGAAAPPMVLLSNDPTTETGSDGTVAVLPRPADPDALLAVIGPLLTTTPDHG